MPPKTLSRLAACEPCREAKLACDHALPICSRCQKRKQAEKCTYRTRPFKKKHKTNSLPYVTNDTVLEDPNVSALSAPTPDASQSISTTTLTHVSPDAQPNPGFLGHSSYKTIFSQLIENQIPEDQVDYEQSQSNHALDYGGSAISTRRLGEKLIQNGLRLLQDILSSRLSPVHSNIVDQCLSGSSTITLLHAFSQSCIMATRELISKAQVEALPEISTQLLRASSNQLDTQGETESFSNSFCGQNTRWETLSIFFLILARAICHDQNPHGIDINEYEARSLSVEAMSFSDRCLTAALDLDCLNDLQLFVQYENFISHSFVDGDQSYSSWRGLGDVISSIYALGYHEDVAGTPSVPVWLQKMRKSVVARAYSADKNVAIFLGRPPRISWRFCSSSVLGQASCNLANVECNKEFWSWPFPLDASFCFEMDTWWSAICARLKEDVLELDRENDQAERILKASFIEAYARAQWDSLPSRHQLSGFLKAHSTSPQERDFAVAAKLNHLHILFLTRRTLARADQGQSHELISVSSSMLSIIAEAMTLSTYLRNSGTSLMWKLVYYGLPAAGILCLYLLSSAVDDFDDISRTRTLQDLSILVAQVSTRAFADRTDPNFSLLDTATTAIQAIIDKLFARTQPRVDRTSQELNTQISLGDGFGSSQWSAWNDLQIQDFEVDFWLNMTNHPAFEVG